MVARWADPSLRLQTAFNWIDKGVRFSSPGILSKNTEIKIIDPNDKIAIHKKIILQPNVFEINMPSGTLVQVKS